MMIPIKADGLRMAEGEVEVVAVVGDELMMVDIDTVKENHAVSLQQEGEHLNSPKNVN